MWQVRVAGLLGASSIGAGAAGAHALAHVDDEFRAIWRTAVSYQQVHALALLATPLAPARARGPAGALFVAGAALFCGSNYAVAWHQDRSFGKLAPYGGTAFIGGWLALAVL